MLLIMNRVYVTMTNNEKLKQAELADGTSTITPAHPDII